MSNDLVIAKSYELASDAEVQARRQFVKDSKLPQTVWVCGSTLLDKYWRAWDCLASSEYRLKLKCAKNYGRFPSDCFAVEVDIMYVPLEFLRKYALELFKGEGI